MGQTLVGLAVMLGVAAMVMPSQAADLRVMTFNLRYATANDGEDAWPKRHDLLLRTIQAFDPDLLGTQEALEVQVAYLSEHLSGYQAVGVGRDDGKRKGEFSAVLFKTARFELLDSGTFWLSETPDMPGSKSWDSSLPRIASWVKLSERNGGGTFLYLNTHWDHRGNQARVESAKLIRRWLQEHAKGVAAIVTGDFNVNDDHAGYRTLVDQTGEGPRLVDVFRAVHPQAGAEEATFHGFSGKAEGRRIDYILATPEFTPREAAIDRTSRDGRYPSDHFPVTAVLRLDATAKP